MPLQDDGPGPRVYASGSSGGDGDKKRPASPWGNLGGGSGGSGGGGNSGGGDRPDPDRGPRKPGGPFGGGPFGGGGGPFGGGGGPFGGGPGGKGYGPELDRLIAQLQGYIRGLTGGGGRRGVPTSHFTGGRGLALLGLLVVVIWVGSGFYRVQPDEQGVVLRFGAYSYWTPPGLHWHLPWPIESVLLPAVTRISRTEIGYRSSNQQSDAGGAASGSDMPSESLMLTGDENIIDINLTVFWKISNAVDYLFNTRDPDNLVKAVAESSIREVIGRTPIQPALTQLRAQIETDVHKQTQQILDKYGTGIEVTQVQLQKVDPPDAVIESFRDVQRANTDAERMRNEAEAYRNDIVPRARGDAAALVFGGEGAKQATIAQATGQAEQFDAVLKAYQAAKDVTLQRMYLDTMQEILAHSQPLVVDDKLKGLLPFLPLNVPPPGKPAPPPAAPSTAAAPGSSQAPSR
jgi:modulator of FtsH protease HflK